MTIAECFLLWFCVSFISVFGNRKLPFRFIVAGFVALCHLIFNMCTYGFCLTIIRWFFIHFKLHLHVSFKAIIFSLKGLYLCRKPLKSLLARMYHSSDIFLNKSALWVTFFVIFFIEIQHTPCKSIKKLNFEKLITLFIDWWLKEFNGHIY